MTLKKNTDSDPTLSSRSLNLPLSSSLPLKGKKTKYANDSSLLSGSTLFLTLSQGSPNLIQKLWLYVCLNHRCRSQFFSTSLPLKEKINKWGHAFPSHWLDSPRGTPNLIQNAPKLSIQITIFHLLAKTCDFYGFVMFRCRFCSLITFSRKESGALEWEL